MINKGLTQEDILKTAQKVYESGWKLIKLYFMIGLPFEQDEDIEDIILLARKVAGLAGKKQKKAGTSREYFHLCAKISHAFHVGAPDIVSGKP